MSGLRIAVVSLGLAAIAVGGVLAQDHPEEAQELPHGIEDLSQLQLPQNDGREASDAETEAWAHSAADRHIKARELAARILQKDASSFVAHLVLGVAYRKAEVNLPKALFHLRRARSLFEGRYGARPDGDAPWFWHMKLIEELANVHGTMEHHAEKLAHIARFNELYEPHKIAERAWPLMKLRRFAEARLAAELGLAEGSAFQRMVALNALCAIEFEAGNTLVSYEACKRAVEDRMERYGVPDSVDLTNLAEASRSLFKLDEAERISLQATSAALSSYGNPWLELGELYLREGRFGESLSALREVPKHRMRRPPHVRDSDRNEMRRALASFLLVLGRPEQARTITERALAAPDRRAHTSRDPVQDRSVLALLDRRARRMLAQQQLEHAATLPFYERPLHWARALSERLAGRRSAGLVQRLLDTDARLVGSLRIGTASAAIMPPWLAGELTAVLGPGIVRDALSRARAKDERPAAVPYYDALAAEVAFAAGEPEAALDHAERALAGLGRAETLATARAMAIAAEAARQQGDYARARKHYASAFQRDPGVFRRLELPLAVRIEIMGGEAAEELAAMLERSPRFAHEDDGLGLQVRVESLSARVCLTSDGGDLISCADTESYAGEDPEVLAARAAADTFEQMFSPRIDLTQIDINSLDGGNLAGRGTLDTLFDTPGD